MKIFSCISHYKTKPDNDVHMAGPVWTPGTQMARFIKRTTIHCYTQNMKALDLVVLEKKIFLCFPHGKSMGANDPRGGAIFDSRGMIHSIYVKLHITKLHTKYRSFGTCGFWEEDFFMYSPL